MLMRRRFFWGSCLFAFVPDGTAIAQCISWRPDSTYPLVGTNGTVHSAIVFDDGLGPALYLGGSFTSAGDVTASGVARWNGTSWSSFGRAGGTVRALSPFDTGSGVHLYEAGEFNQVLWWDGSTWTPIPGNLHPTLSAQAYALASYDDGTGPGLFVGGQFISAGSVPAARIAKWNGSTWSALGSGIGGSGTPEVWALAVFDDGTGPALYAGGYFGSAGGTPASSIARWNGSSWSALGSGIGGNVKSMVVFDDGTGPALFVGGWFGTAGGVPANSVAKWNGSTWSPLGRGLRQQTAFGNAVALGVADDGTGPALYAGGNFTDAGNTPANNVARWDGAAWSAVGSGIGTSSYDIVRALAGFDDGSGPAVFAGGAFASAGGIETENVARWSSGVWSSVGPVGLGTNGTVFALEPFDDGSGGSLYVAGGFTSAGGLQANSIAAWSGSAWSLAGSGMDSTVRALEVFAGGGGPRLYAGGYFATAGGLTVNHLARWNGTNWASVSGGTNGPVLAMAVFDDGAGQALYFGGSFTVAGGPANRIARFDGNSSSPLGSGLDDSVLALAGFDDGNGPALYAGGSFTTAGGNPASKIAKWIGGTWSAVGGGMDGNVEALAVYDDGSGPALYAGGVFQNAGGVYAPFIARWNGTSWSALGPPLNGAVHALAAIDDGTGWTLHAGGSFTAVGSFGLGNPAIWDGTSWRTFDGGMQGMAWAFSRFDDGSGRGPDFYVGGDFDWIGSMALSNFAELYGCAGPGSLFCFGVGETRSCPCLNFGLFGRGCRNSSSNVGAQLRSSGSTSPDTVVLDVDGEPSSALTIFLQGQSRIAPVLFGDGLRCVGGLLLRMYVKAASTGHASAPGAGDPSISTRSAALGDPIPAGAPRYYMTYYRDPSSSFCPNPPGGTFNASNGVKIVW